ncbi:MAG: TetR/AcrR family transcriptional regulator [Bacteroidales bacterium]|nr:TetR/AcrR family transcriptional regulator [Bacteroidales bacterium]
MSESKNSTNTEHLILEAAENEFLNKGFDSAKTTEIAKSAGVTHAMLHYYFRTKENLFNKVFEDRIELFSSSLFLNDRDNDFEIKLDRILESQMAGCNNYEKELRKKTINFLLIVSQMMSRHFDFIVENPLLPRFVVNELISRPERMDNFSERLKDIAGDLKSSFEKDLNFLISQGSINSVSSINLLLDIVSLNVFVFITFPIVKLFALNDSKSAEEFFMERKKENISTILHRLTNDKNLIAEILDVVEKRHQ